MHQGEIAVTIPWTWSLGILGPLWKWPEMTCRTCGTHPRVQCLLVVQKGSTFKIHAATRFQILLPLMCSFCIRILSLSPVFIEVLFSAQAQTRRGCMSTPLPGSNAWLKTSRIGMEGRFLPISPKNMALWDFYHSATIFQQRQHRFSCLCQIVCVCVRPPRIPTLSPSTLEHFFIRYLFTLGYKQVTHMLHRFFIWIRPTHNGPVPWHESRPCNLGRVPSKFIWANGDNTHMKAMKVLKWSTTPNCVHLWLWHRSFDNSASCWFG